MASPDREQGLCAGLSLRSFTVPKKLIPPAKPASLPTVEKMSQRKRTLKFSAWQWLPLVASNVFPFHSESPATTCKPSNMKNYQGKRLLKFPALLHATNEPQRGYTCINPVSAFSLSTVTTRLGAMWPIRNGCEFISGFFSFFLVLFLFFVFRGRCNTLWTLQSTFRGRCRTLWALECRVCGRRRTFCGP